MASLTGHTKRRRQLRWKRAGRAAAKKRTTAYSPQFPVHPEGYDPNAPDAKPRAESQQ